MNFTTIKKSFIPLFDETRYLPRGRYEKDHGKFKPGIRCHTPITAFFLKILEKFLSRKFIKEHQINGKTIYLNANSNKKWKIKENAARKILEIWKKSKEKKAAGPETMSASSADRPKNYIKRCAEAAGGIFKFIGQKIGQTTKKLLNDPKISEKDKFKYGIAPIAAAQDLTKYGQLAAKQTDYKQTARIMALGICSLFAAGLNSAMHYIRLDSGEET